MRLLLLGISLSTILISFFFADVKVIKKISDGKVGQAVLPTTSTPTPSPTFAPTPTPEKKVPKKKIFVMASIPYWDQERASGSFRRNVDVIDEISLFWYYLKLDGQIAKYSSAEEDTSLISFAKKNNVKTLALFANLPDDEGDWDPNRVDKVIGNPTTRANHIREIVSIVELFSFDGANIDYENLREDQKDNFSAFIKDLAFELHKRGKRLRVPVYTQDENGETHGQDLVELSKVVDELGLMTYYEHWDGGQPGPIASIGWVREQINFAIKLGVTRRVIFLGVPLFGLDWPLSGGGANGLEYDEISSLIKTNNAQVQFNQKFASPYFEYDGRVVWFENARSISEKIKLARDLGVGGIAFWRLGGEDPEIWNVLRELKSA